METTAGNFIEEFIEEFLRQHTGAVIQTRFPPEPNGYLHIGHCKAICINFGIKEKYKGRCNLRMDDTNPEKEDQEYADAIQRDISWLGFQWDKLTYGSDYYPSTFECALKLIKKGLAYVCQLTAEQISETRGTLTQPGTESPWRGRAPEENLSLFMDMKNGRFADGECVLRAKIDMASPNMNLRDPVIYRIRRVEHYRTGCDWIIYPMYDFAHPIQDALEGVTHSLCSLEFENHRPLYNWVVENLEFPNPPRQIEFARLNLTRAVMSKRYLKKLVDTGAVAGWDDPRMPTISGARRRGYPPAAIRDFISRVGVSKADSVVDAGLLEHCVRENLNEHAPRRMGILNPLPVIIDNLADAPIREVTLQNHNQQEQGTRAYTFSGNLYIEREDFALVPPPKFHRLYPGNEVRLLGAYIIRCTHAEVDAAGNPTLVHCTLDPDSFSGMPGANRKVKGTLHWLDAANALPARYRLYDYLLDDRDDPELDFTERLNPASLQELNGYAEPALAEANVGDTFQLLRTGYFRKDESSAPGLPVFNRVVGLRDSYAKAKQDNG